MHSAESSFLVGLEGTEVTTEAKPGLQLPSKTWIIAEKLEELSLFMSQWEIDAGHKPGFAAAKFLCYPKDDPAKELAFMRIYRQIPVSGTEWSPSHVRATQAVPRIEIKELTAFKSLMKQACPVVPKLLGYDEGSQRDDGIVPGGYGTTIVWEKVPGAPLSEEYFWSLDRVQRDSIRDEFRRVLEQLLQCGVMPCMATSTKIIYDESTGTMHISGFRMAAPVPRDRKWSNADYVMFGLANPSHKTDWYNDETGWEF